MTIRDCPDCTTGWRHGGDMPGHKGHPKSGLVRCPTCRGEGRVTQARTPRDAGHAGNAGRAAKRAS